MPKKRTFFVIVFYTLLARFWGSLETSRLILMQFRPGLVMKRNYRREDPFPQCHWLFASNTLYCVSVDNSENRMLITATQPIDLN